MVKYLLSTLLLLIGLSHGQLCAEESLSLIAKVKGKSTLYPGERTTLLYRYTFMGEIALTKETLPLLEANGLEKVGEVEIKDFSHEKESVREISQVVQAKVPGDFTFAQSTIEGVVYTKENNRRQISGRTLTSTAPAITLHVLSFPKTNRPGSFNGAIGRYQFSVKIAEEEKTFNIEDNITLLIAIKNMGHGILENVPLPDIKEQPEFKEMFRFSDLPIKSIISSNEKIFTVVLQPLLPQIEEIPPIKFSFFDPDDVSYTELTSPSIPIKIKSPTKKESTSSIDRKKTVDEKIHIHSLTLSPPSLHNFSLPFRQKDKNLSLANALYAKGVKSKSPYEQWNFFQEALTLYLQLEAKYHPTFGDGKLYFQIGNAYFQLKRYPRAIAMYEKALNFSPMSSMIQDNLQKTREILHLPPNKDFLPITKILAINYWLPLKTRLQLFVLTILFFFIAATFAIKTKSRTSHFCLVAAIVLFCLFGSSLAITRYFSPLQGTLLKSTILDNTLLLAGSTVEIVGFDEAQGLLSVVTEDGKRGAISMQLVYVP